MEIIYTYKLQSDGKDSWVVEEIDNGKTVAKYMIYEDPNKKDNASNLDISSFTDAQILELKTRLNK